MKCHRPCPFFLINMVSFFSGWCHCVKCYTQIQKEICDNVTIQTNLVNCFTQSIIVNGALVVYYQSLITLDFWNKYTTVTNILMCVKQVLLLLIWVKVAAWEVVKSLYNLAIIICAPTIQIGFSINMYCCEIKWIKFETGNLLPVKLLQHLCSVLLFNIWSIQKCDSKGFFVRERF